MIMSQFRKKLIDALREYYTLYLNMELITMSNITQCESCGSVKFRQIKPDIYECEYCGRMTSCASQDQPINMIGKDVALLGYVVLDPTRTLSIKFSKT